MSRVLLHSLVFAPDGVSTAYLMSDLAVGLKRLGHEVTVLTTTPHYNLDATAPAWAPLEQRWGGLLQRTDYRGVRVWHVKVRRKRQTLWARVPDFLWFHLFSLVAAFRIVPPQDVVIATSPPLTIGFVSWLLGRRWRGASVYRVAELYPDLAIRQGAVRHRGMIAALEWMERTVYERNTAIVAIAEQFARIIRQRGVDDRRLRVIPDFVDTDFFRPLPRDNAFAREHGLTEGFVALYGGNIGLVQDWESVLSTAAMLADRPIMFVVVGDGVRRDWLRLEIERRGLNNVKLIGYQPKSLMPMINASCDLAIIPMTRSGALDGFPSKVYTLMASAKPVLVSAGMESEMASLVNAAGCGRLVNPEEPAEYAAAVLKAFAERDRLPAEGARGRRFVEQRYSSEAVSASYDGLIKELTVYNTGAPQG